MEYPGVSTPSHLNGLLIKTEPGTQQSGYLSPLPPHIDPDFLPLSRARSNTWPLPRPEEPSGGTHQGQVHSDNNCEPSCPADTGALLGFPKKPTSRRNAWGNLSYADLITQAIHSAPDKRLTLSQIYDWMVSNVAYFKDKGDSNSSAGWKNSIRHNLSLHNRFMRVQNEGTGKSSWWILNPDAKPGKAARRRATSMETSKFEKKRGRVKKKIEAMRNGSMGLVTPSPPHSSSLAEGLDSFSLNQQQHSPLVQGLYNLSPSSDFRGRANSNASSCGGRLSPILGEPLGEFTPGGSSGGGDEGGWDYPYSYPSPDRFGPDQLALGLQHTMKLGGDSNNGYDFNSPYPPLPNQQSFSQGGNGFRSSSGAPLRGEGHGELLNGLYGTGLQFHQPHHLYNSHHQNHQAEELERGMVDMKPDILGGGHQQQCCESELEFQLDLDPSAAPFECNVEEVLQGELSLGEGIDFNFGPSTHGNNGGGSTSSPGPSSSAHPPQQPLRC